MKNLIKSAIFCLVLFACTETEKKIVYKDLKQEKSIPTLKGEVINDELLVRTSVNMYVHNSELILLGSNGESYFQIYDLNNGEHKGSSGFIGNARYELPQYIGDFCLSGNNLIVHSNSTHASIFNADKLLSGGEDCFIGKTKITDKSESSKLCRLEEDKFLAVYSRISEFQSTNVDKRFAIITGGKEEYAYRDVQTIFDNSSKNINFWSPMATPICVRKDGKKVAVGTKYGAILEIYNVESNPAMIELENVNYIVEPDYTYSETKNGQAIETVIQGNENTIYGFKYLYSTDNYIYALYYGEKYSKNFKPDLVVFNWKGEYIKRYEIEENLKLIAVDDDDKVLYGIPADNACKLIRYQL